MAHSDGASHYARGLLLGLRHLLGAQHAVGRAARRGGPPPSLPTAGLSAEMGSFQGVQVVRLVRVGVENGFVW